MSQQIDFYFDFSSPYGYFSSEKIEAIAERCNCQVMWHPYLMGVVMKITGRKPLVNIPMVNDYSARDLQRNAKFHGIEFHQPSIFPVATVAACRLFYWLNERDKTLAKQYAQRIFRAYFVHNKLISKPDVVSEVAKTIGVNANESASALADQRIKSLLRTATDDAISRKVFGSPFFIVGDEPFWGHDRLDQLERWISEGGW